MGGESLKSPVVKGAHTGQTEHRLVVQRQLRTKDALFDALGRAVLASLRLLGGGDSACRRTGRRAGAGSRGTVLGDCRSNRPGDP